DWSKHPLDDNYFMQTAHIFESRDQRNIDLFNGCETDANKAFYKNFMKTLGGNPKPCTAGSDAHVFSDYGKYPSNKATWIKGALSFSGLEQIRYEPTERVKIQELKPEEKSSQDLIDRVEFIGKNSEKQVVYLNQNLNSLIGSRAQGKSNLLKNIAYAVDPKQALQRGVTIDDFLPLDSFQVFWADGTENTLASEQAEEKTKGILFIPQKYLGELIYDKNPQFDTFLINLFENKDDFQTDLAMYRKFEDQNALAVTSTLQELMEARRLGLEKAEKAKKLGNVKSFEIEIKDLEDRIKKAGANLSISEADLEQYDNLRGDRKKSQTQLEAVQSDIESLSELKDEDVINTDRLDEFEFTQATYEKIQKKLGETDLQFKKEFVEQEIKNLTAEKTKIVKQIADLTKKIEPLKEKIKKNQALLELTKLLEKKKATKQQIVDLVADITKQRTIFQAKRKTLIDKYLDFEKEFRKLKVNLGELKFSKVKLVISFDEKSLRRLVEDSINYHNSTEFRKDEEGRYSNANRFLDDPVGWHYGSTEDFKQLLSELTSGILNGKLLLKSGRDRQIVLTSLLKNRYKIDFLKSVSSKTGVSFPDMSDGEQMLALLEFIFKFDDYNYPVLLDQPEDDLDAKAISSTVVDFIKREKTNRQIFIASHNANLVVCGDSENVVISQKHAGRTPFFSYATGAIEDASVNGEIVEILEGGDKAFKVRRNKLGIK
ncbi:MAG TPA: hypothetical protein VFT87_05270, partial [Candidatus Saccharimonadales bacterium]|nr:hypothetical protein [Candidatus Saccharimonadales bacterium]